MSVLLSFGAIKRVPQSCHCQYMPYQTSLGSAHPPARRGTRVRRDYGECHPRRLTDSAALRQIPGNEKILETARQRNPSRRLMLPEDVARTIAALCHPATYWLTGNVLQVDGGENIVG
jgi:NAD(P)-dependent dehydrogenase (short-subunit alcohol dehydrogenase family)